MSLAYGLGPLAPGGGDGHLNFERPDDVVFTQLWRPRLRAVFAGETVLDTEAAIALHRTGAMLQHWIPLADVRKELLRVAGGGQGSGWRVCVGPHVADGEVKPYEAAAGDPDLGGYANFAQVSFDRWYEEDDPVYAHLRDPYHRVDVHSSSRHVVVQVAGQTVADTTRPKLLFETGLPTRYYIPFADVRVDLLERSDTISECPYKGDGQHWHVTVDGHRINDAAWSLPHPLPEGLSAAEHVCFYPDKTTTRVGGEAVNE